VTDALVQANDTLRRSPELALAAELGPCGVRAVCLRPHHIADSGLNADPRLALDEFRRLLEDMTLLKRLATLAEVANTAVFVASAHAASMTGGDEPHRRNERGLRLASGGAQKREGEHLWLCTPQ
jgi:NAD(P)-dependent dehydrogenase (short-subunit alcohol dehydrogenase family)